MVDDLGLPLGLAVRKATGRDGMSEAPSKTPDLSPASLHFQILLLGTVIFLAALFWLTQLPQAATHEARVAAAVPRLLTGIQALGCYVAFVSIVLGHRVLQTPAESKSERND